MKKTARRKAACRRFPVPVLLAVVLLVFVGHVRCTDTIAELAHKDYDLGRDDILRHYSLIGKESPYYFVKKPNAWEELLNSLAYDSAF